MPAAEILPDHAGAYQDEIVFLRSGLFALFIMDDITLLRVSRESSEGLLHDCSFQPGPYAAHLCAAVVPPPPHSDDRVVWESYR